MIRSIICIGAMVTMVTASGGKRPTRKPVTRRQFSNGMMLETEFGIPDELKQIPPMEDVSISGLDQIVPADPRRLNISSAPEGVGVAAATKRKLEHVKKIGMRYIKHALVLESKLKEVEDDSHKRLQSVFVLESKMKDNYEVMAKAPREHIPDIDFEKLLRGPDMQYGHYRYDKGLCMHPDGEPCKCKAQSVSYCTKDGKNWLYTKPEMDAIIELKKGNETKMFGKGFKYNDLVKYFHCHKHAPAKSLEEGPQSLEYLRNHQNTKTYNNEMVRLRKQYLCPQTGEWVEPQEEPERESSTSEYSVIEDYPDDATDDETDTPTSSS